MAAIADPRNHFALACRPKGQISEYAALDNSGRPIAEALSGAPVKAGVQPGEAD